MTLNCLWFSVHSHLYFEAYRSAVKLLLRAYVSVVRIPLAFASDSSACYFRFLCLLLQIPLPFQARNSPDLPSRLSAHHPPTPLLLLLPRHHVPRYSQYRAATVQALVDLRKEDSTNREFVVMVVGAGRGPLVRQVLAAATGALVFWLTRVSLLSSPHIAVNYLVLLHDVCLVSRPVAWRSQNALGSQQEHRSRSDGQSVRGGEKS